jgi:branched-subunit amino acid transport protein
VSAADAILTILGLAVITLVTRGLFLMPAREVPMPGWARRALKYAPLAALVAIVAPEVLTSGGVLVGTLADARLLGATAGLAHYFWRRGILGTIVVGMAVFLPLRIGLGW